MGYVCKGVKPSFALLKTDVQTLTSLASSLTSGGDARSYEVWWNRASKDLHIVAADLESRIANYERQLEAAYPSIAFYALPICPPWLSKVSDLRFVQAFFKKGFIFTKLPFQGKGNLVDHVLQAIQGTDFAWAQLIWRESDWHRYAVSLSTTLGREIDLAKREGLNEKSLIQIGPEITEEILEKSLAKNIRAEFRFLCSGSSSSLTAVVNSLSVFQGKYDQLTGNVSYASAPILRTFVERNFVSNKFDDTLRNYQKTFFEDRMALEFLLLTPDELAAFLQLPVTSGLRFVKWTRAKSLPTISPLSQQGVLLGYQKSTHLPIRIDMEDLSRHTYVVGGSGVGKTTLILNVVKQLRESKTPLAIHFIDPHGDASNKLLRILPNWEGVTLFDPVTANFSINPLQLPPYRSTEDRELKVEWVIGVFMQMLETLFGVTTVKMPRLTFIVETSLRYLYKITDTPTMVDLYAVLLALRDRDRLKQILDQMNVDDAEITSTLEFATKLPADAVFAILNKIGTFTSNPLLRKLFCSPQPNINFQELIKPGRLVIWRIAKDRVPPNVLIMSMNTIVLTLWFAVLFRAGELDEDKRSPVVTVVDEFQNLQELALLDVIPSEARKYGMPLFLIHQNLAQLNHQRRESILANSATKVMFRVSGTDASSLAADLDPMNAKELAGQLTTLADFNALVRLRAKGQEEQVAPHHCLTLPDPPTTQSPERVRQFEEEMRQEFAAPESIGVSLIENALERRWVKLLSEPVPDPLTFQVLETVKALGNEAYAKRIAETLSKDRSRIISPKLDELERTGFLTSEVATERTTPGRPPTIFSLTSKSNGLLLIEGVADTLSDAHMGGEEAIALGCEAVKHYRAKGWLVIILRQGGTLRKPDLVAIPLTPDGEWDLERAVAVEVESLSELSTHPEQVKINMSKNFDAGFSFVDIWCRKQFSATLDSLYRSLPLERQEKISVKYME